MLFHAPSVDWVLSIGHRLDFAPASCRIEDQLAVGSLLDAFLDDHERSFVSQQAAGARIRLGFFPSNRRSDAEPAMAPGILLDVWREQCLADPDLRCDLVVRRSSGSGAANELILDLTFPHAQRSVATPPASSPCISSVLLSTPVALATDRRFFDILTRYAFYQGVLASVYAERIIAAMRIQLSPDSIGVVTQLDYLPLTDLECEADLLLAFREELSERDQAPAPVQFCAFALAATRLLLQLLLLCQECLAYWRCSLALRGADGTTHALPTAVEVCTPLAGPRGLGRLLASLLVTARTFDSN